MKHEANKKGRTRILEGNKKYVGQRGSEMRKKESVKEQDEKLPACDFACVY